MTERRFNEEEVAQIFQRASEAHQSSRVPLANREGMTLGDLQEIGREVGLSPELVAQAARSVEQTGRTTSRRFLGFPIGVGRTVDLDRKLSDAEWERLVVDLRETFDARGSLKEEGSFRQWTNGNLQALLEPVGETHRLRLRTLKSTAQTMMIAGLALFGVGLVNVIESVVRGGTLDIGKTVFFGLMSVAIFGVGALQVPAWARERRRQMEEIIARLAAGNSSEPRRDVP